MTAPQLDIFAPRAPMLRDRTAPLAVVPPPPSSIQPRDYQRRTIEAVRATFATMRSTLAILATGLGKTVIASVLARELDGVLFLAHRETLIEQAAQKLRHVTGEYVGVEKAERHSKGAKFVVGSVQTLKGDRLAGFAQTHPHVKFIVIDECHRAVAQSYRSILEAFPAAKVLGLTATADRGDKRALATVFEKADTEHGAAFKYDIVDATADGWLTVGDWFPLNIDGVSLDDVGTKGNDIDQGALDDAVVLQAAQIASGMHKAAAGEMSLAFTPGVKTAECAAEALNRIVPGCARATWGEQDPTVRAAIESGWRRGEFPYLLNCALYIEGADFPELRNVFMFAATKSRLRWAQIYGRGTRLWPHGIDHLPTAAERLTAIAASPKPRWRFFDAQYGKHGHTLAGPVDLLGGLYDDEVKERAKKKLGETGGDVAAALEGAKQEIEKAKRLKLIAAAARAAKARGAVLVGAARDACELFGVATDMGPEDEHRGQPDQAVVDWLVEKGVKNADKMTPGAARALKKKLIERRDAGLGTYKMVRALKKAGHPYAARLTFNECSALMGTHLGPAYKRGDWNYQFPAEMFREPGQEG